jgi:glycerophosphoryl diester phosphodiesterase
VCDLPSSRQCLAGAFGDLRRNLAACLAYQVLLVAGSMFIASPLASLAYGSLMAIYGTPVLTNEQILAYALSPSGLASILFGGMLWFCSLYAGAAAGLMAARRVEAGLPVAPFLLLRSVLPRIPTLLLIGMRHFLVLAAVGLLAAGMVGAAYALLLGGHDINYYLAGSRPSSWQRSASSRWSAWATRARLYCC